MQEWLIYLVSAHPYAVYLFIVLLACTEGSFLFLIFGVLIKLGYFGFIPVYLALISGNLIGDVVWYYIGFMWGHKFIGRFGKNFGITEDEVTKVTETFHKHKYPILFVSKITNGFGFALVVLITAGIVRIPFALYMVVNIIGQFIWAGMLIGIGYFFSDLYLQIDTILGRVMVIIGFIIILIIFLKYRKYLKDKSEKFTG